MSQNTTHSIYRTVFEVTQVNRDTASILYFGLWMVFVCVAIYLLHRFNIVHIQTNRSQKIVVAFAVAGALAIYALWVVIVTNSHSSAASALREGRAKVVEGPIMEFKPMPYHGHAMESFTVSGVTFKYSDFVSTGGFNRTSSHGGPIREGLYVKVWYLDDRILRIDVRD